MIYLANKHILLGITGSIAAYKSADLVRRLREVNAEVQVAMTKNAKRFITPLTMQAVSGSPIHDDLFDLQAEAAMGHIELARWADLILIAPASADFMTRLAEGQTNDLLTAVCLASKAKVALAPAMNQGMWKNRLTQKHLKSLKQKKVHILGPGEGSQACGDVGPGRMLEPLEIIKRINDLFSTGALAGVRVLITAGPTHEAIDPVRFITNASSGKMAFALAEAAREAGAQVLVVSGPVTITKPKEIRCIDVTSAKEMFDCVMKNVPAYDIFLAVAAVGDYHCRQIAKQKLHKRESTVTLTLEPNPDIVKTVGELSKRPFIVGFAAETTDLIKQAQSKRQKKKMDMIIANRVGKGIGMGSDKNAVVVMDAKQKHSLPLMDKRKLARQLITLIAKSYKKRRK